LFVVCTCSVPFNWSATPWSLSLSLHDALPIFCKGVDLVDTDTSGANHIAQLLLSRGSLNNPQNDVRDFLRVAGRGGKCRVDLRIDRKSTRLNSSHQIISYAVFCLKKKRQTSVE